MTKSPKKVIIYTTDYCPFCVRAVQFFKEKNIDFEEIDLSQNESEMQRIKTETGWRTVPIILINNQLIGGYTDLKALDDQGKLETLLSSLK